MKQNISHIIKFLQANEHSISKDDFYKQLSSHPDFPSLYAITDTFKFLGVENIAAKVPREEFDNLPETFLAVTKEGKDQNIVYIKKKSSSILLYSSEKQNKILNTTDFFNIWEDIIVAVEPNPSPKSSSAFSENRVLYILLSISVLLGLSYIIYSNPSFDAMAYFVLTGIGLILSIFIVRENLGIHSAAIEKICNAGSQTSCREVLSSKGAQISPYFSLSDLCLIYFSSLALVILLLPYQFNNLALVIISSMSILFALYSIFYQAFILKKWCMLCLGVILVLILQFTVVLFSYESILNLNSFLAILASLFIITCLWFGFKQVIVKLESLKKSEIEFLKLKRNKKIFKMALENEKKIDPNELNALHSIKIGTASAPEIIYGFLSPSCGHCIQAFKNYKELVNLNPQQLQIRLMFNINPHNKENPYLEVAHTILNISINEGNQKGLSAMEQWFDSEFDFDLWKQKYTNSENVETFRILEMQHNLCLENGINYTPATIYKDHLYPMEFELIDIKFFMDDQILSE